MFIFNVTLLHFSFVYTFRGLYWTERKTRMIRLWLIYNFILIFIRGILFFYFLILFVHRSDVHALTCRNSSPALNVRLFFPLVLHTCSRSQRFFVIRVHVASTLFLDVNEIEGSSLCRLLWTPIAITFSIFPSTPSFIKISLTIPPYFSVYIYI